MPDIKEIKARVMQSKEYNFLRTNVNLGQSIILLTLGGSYAYGTNVEGSDIDVRGCALNSREQILTGNTTMFEQVENKETDTVIYAFNKLIKLLSNCNPNVIEMLGCKQEHYIYLSNRGKELINNKSLFLSQKVINSFGGYANSQLRRLENKANIFVAQEQQTEHLYNTLNYALEDIRGKYSFLSRDALNLFLQQNENKKLDIVLNMNLKNYPLKDYVGLLKELQNIESSYSKLGKRNEQAIHRGKLGKHMMHLIRLYITGLDILEKGEIITYREQEHALLMDIRNNKYLTETNQPTEEFYDMLNSYEKRFEYAKKNTILPQEPDYKKIQDLVMHINESVVWNTKGV